MTRVFFAGAILTAFCSWLLAVALISSLILGRQLTQTEITIAFISAVFVAAGVAIALKRKLHKERDNL